MLAELFCSRQTVCEAHMVHAAPSDWKKKNGTSTAAQALQAPISVPAPAAPALLEPVSLVPASAPPTPATPVPSALPLHEIQDFDRKFSTAVGKEPEGLWSPNPFTLGREPSIPPRPDQWAAVRKQAAAEGDANLLHTFPVIYQPNQLPRWESLLYGVIKELHCSAVDNGISPPFTSLLETVVNSYNLAPQVFKQIAQIMLTNIQFTVRMSEWRELCTVEAMDNSRLPWGRFCNLSVHKLLWGKANMRRPQCRLSCLWKLFGSQRSSLCGLFVKCRTAVSQQPHLST